MRIISCSNVNVAFDFGLKMLIDDGVPEPSRAGSVLVMPFPVVTCYLRPYERVLLNPVRDANPFFHLFESLWMLAGRDDGKFLDRFVSDFSSRFAEEGGVIHGAYGHRWRNHFGVDGRSIIMDQLRCCIDLLKRNPSDRRVVIQMWDPEADLGYDAKDVPCNLCVLPRIVERPSDDNGADGDLKFLDITVMCRSNDAVWGAYGANAVQFGFLQEYLARMIGVEIGRYYQISNNFHVYTDVLDKVKVGGPIRDPYKVQDFRPRMTPHPLVTDTATFDEDLLHFLSNPEPHSYIYSNSFFECVAEPMWRAHAAYKLKHWNAAFEALLKMSSSNDWYRAAYDWLMRRKEKVTSHDNTET